MPIKPKVNIFNFENIFGKNKNCSCKKEQEIFDLTRDVVCYNQGKIAEYYFLHDKYQQELFSLMHKIISTQSNELVDELIALYDKYNEHISNELQQIVQKNLSFSDKYFADRKESPVRGCIKILDSKLNVIDPFRANGKDYKYTRNTGFQRLIDHNKNKNHFLENNIPEAVAAETYKNTRIDTDCIKKYYASIKPKNKIVAKIKGLIYDQEKQRIEKEWLECWKGYGGKKANHADCYKSTLIIPMTFKNNILSAEFKARIKGKKEINALGFLCFDHVDIDYFEADMDINFCYKIADLVSLFLIKDFISQNNKQFLTIEHFIEYIRKNLDTNKKNAIQDFIKTKKLK